MAGTQTVRTNWFAQAWRDVTASPRALGTVALLALLMMIPIFGQIVVFGFAYGWARDAAWGVKSPLPRRIFEDPDGRLFSRGFFALVIMFIWGLVFSVVLNFLFSGAFMSALAVSGVSVAGALASLGVVGFVAIVVAVLSGFALGMLQQVTVMHMAVYGTFSSGFQLGRLWKMVRRDFGGIAVIVVLKVAFEMLAAVLVIVALVLAGLVVFTLFAPLAVAGVDTALSAGSVAFLGLLLLLGMVGLWFVMSMVTVVLELVAARATGYWFSTFDVPAWGGVSDPLPFEREDGDVGGPAPKPAAPVETEAPAAEAGAAAAIADKAEPAKPAAAAGTAAAAAPAAKADAEPELPAGPADTEPELPAGDAAGEPELPAGDSAGEPELPASDAAGEAELPAGDAAGEPELPAGDAAAEPELPAGPADTEAELPAGDAAGEPGLPSGDEEPELPAGDAKKDGDAK